MGFRYGATYGTAYYGGAGSDQLSANKVLDVALGGHGYMIDWSAELPLHHQSIPLTRQQADQSDQPGEQTINPEGLWRRFGESWHVGAGQEQYDREESNPFMFFDSQGVNVWERWELTLLPDTEQLLATVEENLFLATAGNHLYATNGNNIQFYTDFTTPTVLTGQPVDDPTSIVSDGFNVWTSHSTSGVYLTTRGSGTTASQVTGTVTLLGRARGRVFAAAGQSIYDITTEAYGGGALPAVHFTHSNPDWTWTAFAESATHIYAAGFSGDKSEIYAFTIDEDGLTLTQPVVVAVFSGESVVSLMGHLSQFVAVGTDRGWRLATATDNGTLQIGSLTETPQPVQTFTGFQEFIWFGFSNFTATATGLGRMSTATFSDIENLVPAYASDLMVANETADVISSVTFLERRVFAVAGVGIYFESLQLVESGHLDTGLISYNMTEHKIGIWFDIDHDGDFGSVEIFARSVTGSFVSIGEHHGAHDTLLPSFGLGEVSSPAFEFRIVIHKDDTENASQRFSSWLLRSQPRSDPSRLIFGTILLADKVENREDVEIAFDTYAELEHINRIWQRRQVTTWQQGNRSWSVFLEDYDLNTKYLMSRPGSTGFNGSVTLRMKVLV